ncbi:hypothetical protein BJ741DRAFT_652905 [Chytriomyces cf. hyalinus JEL632]|nr:hypothetical protein BJ741DRAFT_652905 [Chytriomyces cf. hyalinus JEL632]
MSNEKKSFGLALDAVAAFVLITTFVYLAVDLTPKRAPVTETSKTPASPPAQVSPVSSRRGFFSSIVGTERETNSADDTEPKKKPQRPSDCFDKFCIWPKQEVEKAAVPMKETVTVTATVTPMPVYEAPKVTTVTVTEKVQPPQRTEASESDSQGEGEMLRRGFRALFSSKEMGEQEEKQESDQSSNEPNLDDAPDEMFEVSRLEQLKRALFGPSETESENARSETMTDAEVAESESSLQTWLQNLVGSNYAAKNEEKEEIVWEEDPLRQLKKKLFGAGYADSLGTDAKKEKAETRSNRVAETETEILLAELKNAACNGNSVVAHLVSGIFEKYGSSCTSPTTEDKSSGDAAYLEDASPLDSFKRMFRDSQEESTASKFRKFASKYIVLND